MELWIIRGDQALSAGIFEVDENGRAIVEVDGSLFLQGVGSLPPRLGRGTTEAKIPVRGGGSLYVGLRDDPFFFDLVAFQDQVLGAGGSRTFCDGNENDFFAGAKRYRHRPGSAQQQPDGR